MAPLEMSNSTNLNRLGDAMRLLLVLENGEMCEEKRKAIRGAFESVRSVREEMAKERTERLARELLADIVAAVKAGKLG